jgi:translation initiation factor 2 subunit 1
MEIVKSKAKITDSQLHEIEDKILQKYDYIYDVFETVAKKGIESIQNLELPTDVLKAVEEESSKIQIPHVEIRGVMEISLKKSNGVDTITNILTSVEASKSGINVSVTYVGAPKYRIVVTAENFKVAERAMNSIIEKVRLAISKYHGTFNFIREESKRTHQG